MEHQESVRNITVVKGGLSIMCPSVSTTPQEPSKQRERREGSLPTHETPVLFMKHGKKHGNTDLCVVRSPASGFTTHLSLCVSNRDPHSCFLFGY